MAVLASEGFKIAMRNEYAFPPSGSGAAYIEGAEVEEHAMAGEKNAEFTQQLLSRAVEAAPQGVVLTDCTRADNPIIYCNAGFEKLTGFKADEILNRNCRFLQGPLTDEATLGQLRAAIRERRPCSVVLCNYRKDRTPFWNALTVTPIRDDDGVVRHFVGVQTDISAVKQMEAEYRQAQKMEVVGRLAGGVAHDFNNLLTVINGFSDIVAMLLPEKHPARDPALQIRKAGERATALTRQMLSFSRKQHLQSEIVSLNALLTDSEKMLTRVAGPRIKIQFNFAKDLPGLRADPTQIEQVVLNLIVNARDAMPEGGDILVETGTLEPAGAEGARVYLLVRDTGHGMTDEVKNRLFEPFFTTKPVGRGTGLGLATVRSIMEQSEGKIDLESAVGQGTSFRMSWPRVDASAGNLAHRHALNAAARRGSEIILFVEDEDEVRGLAVRALQMYGYTVLEARHGSEAIDICQSHVGPIHLVISDLEMPGMTAQEFADKLPTLRPQCKLLFVSGYAEEELMPSGVRDGSVPFLAKPFVPESLAAKVREVLKSV